jgi:hypothetical protein
MVRTYSVIVSVTAIFWASMIVTVDSQAKGASPSPRELLDALEGGLRWTTHVAATIEVRDLPQPEGEVENYRGGLQRVRLWRNGERVDLRIQTFAVAGADGALEPGTEFRAIVTEELALSYEHMSGKSPTSLVWSRDVENYRRDLLRSWAGPLHGFLPNAIGSGVLPTILRGGRNLRQRDGDEIIDGEPCRVLEADTAHGHIAVWLAPNRKWAALKIVLDRQYTQADRRADLAHEPGADPRARYYQGWTFVLDQVETQEIGGFVIPMAARTTITSRSAKGQVVTVTQLLRQSDVDVQPDFAARGAFVMDAPEGIEAVSADPDTGGVSYRWLGGKIVPMIDESAAARIDHAVRELNSRNARAAEVDATAPPTSASSWTGILVVGGIIIAGALVVTLAVVLRRRPQVEGGL